MSKYTNFIFDNYEFDLDSKNLRFYYSYDGILNFCETYRFNFEFTNYSPEALDRAVYSLFIMSGISYFKAYLAPNIIINIGKLSEVDYHFFKNIYQKGLGEFYFVNNLDPLTEINFPKDFIDKPQIEFDSTGVLLGIGGGKDSLLSYEFLKDTNDTVTTWSLDHQEILEPLVKTMGTKHLYVEREWDRRLLKLNSEDAYNGHIPISAIFGLVGAVTAILSGNKDIIVSNEQSADEVTLKYRGININHQYSKSSEFEESLKRYLVNNFGNSINYFSLLRPFSEVYISELFAENYFEKYKNVFSSCNNAFTNDSHKIYWCGKCPKCAFIFLAFTPFIDRAKLESLWGKNLIQDPYLDQTYRQIIGIYGDKPLDCVGEIKESRAAMRLAQKIYPELAKYHFDLPKDYDYKTLGNFNNMPKTMMELIKKKIKI